VTPERLRQIERLFHEARERSPAGRDAFLARACADDPALRREVESLLAQPPAGVIDAPVGEFVAQLIAPPAPQLAPGSIVGPYRIERLLDVGGMGEVYLARDTTLGRDVAIKILPQPFTADAERLARFEREARLLAALNHPNIGAIYGLETVNGVMALVLELAAGETLAVRIRRGPASLTDALAIACHIADALDAAVSSRGENATPIARMASRNGFSPGKATPVSAQTASQATRAPSRRQRRRAFADRIPCVASAPKISRRTFVSTAVITHAP